MFREQEFYVTFFPQSIQTIAMKLNKKKTYRNSHDCDAPENFSFFFLLQRKVTAT